MFVCDQLPAITPHSAVLHSARSNLFRALDRFPLLEEATNSLQRLRLDVRCGKSSPATLLEEAKSALDRPAYRDGSPVAVLICLRECIDASISEMVRRRRNQEPVTGGWKGKVAAIGRQCARAALPAGHFEQVGEEIETVMNELSGTKQAAMPRQQLLEKFNRALLSLNSLLSSIDESLLR